MGFVVPSRQQGAKCHLPVAIVIDRSRSTQDIRGLLNDCAQKLVQSMKGDLLLRNVVELLVIQYGSEYNVVVDFMPLSMIGEQDLDIPKSKGFTATGRALLYALQRLDEKKVEWKLRGEKYYQPLMFLLTDGYPDAGKGAPAAVERAVQDDYAEAARYIHQREKDSKMAFFAAGIQQRNGVCANMEKLQELSSHPERIVRVTDSVGSVFSVEKFYDLIYASTVAVLENTPFDEVVGDFFGRKSGARS